MRRQRSLRLRLLIAAAAACLYSILAPPVLAQDLCSDMEFLIEHSKIGFRAIRGAPESEPGTHGATFLLPEASRCVVVMNLERRSYRCRWVYAYRDERAYAAFDRFADSLRRCFGAMAKEHVDRNVNHPDFYAARRYEMAEGAVTVSVKDKAAMGSTFVFISVEGPPKTQ